MYSRDTRVTREVLVDELLRGAALDVELLREAERAHAVDQPEVHGLDVAPLIGTDLLRRDAEDLARGRAMDVVSFMEGVQERRIGRKVRHDAQLDLRVVGRHQHVRPAAR